MRHHLARDAAPDHRPAGRGAGGRSGGRALEAAPLAVLLLAATLLSLDVVTDVRQGAVAPHVALEGAAVVVTLGAILLAWWVLRRSLARSRALAMALRRSRSDHARSRADAARLLQTFGELLDARFAEMDLSPGERDVALLMLRGFSLPEIADHLPAPRPKVRRQAEAVYRKASGTGHVDLAALFLDSMLQRPWRPGADPSSSAPSLDREP